VAYLLARLPLPAAGFAVALLPLAGRWPLTLLAVALFAGYIVAGIAAALADRRLVALLRREAVPDPHGERRGAAATRREGLHALLAALLAPLDALLLFVWLLGALALIVSPALLGEGPVAAGPWTIDTAAEAWTAVPVGLVVLLAGTYAAVALAELHAWLARELLAPRGEELAAQLTELSRSRLRLIDAFDVERRRIERDLHDGAQQQLVALAMTLDLARIELEPTAHEEAKRLVDHAHGQATRTIKELRDLIHAIHPPVLADRGLPGAVAELADRSALPVTVAADLPERLPETIETAAYFVLSEAIANAVKHSGARAIEVDLRVAGGALRLAVKDEGHGGANPGRGTGLAGLGDRVAAVGGRLTLTSPLGGPTVVRAELPCR
jgi:signal transduction histidine kinase